MPQRDDTPVIFCLHFLGGSAREWGCVAERLDGAARVVAIDLPGFGDATDIEGYSVAEMATYVASKVRADAPERWLIAGHSMGAKVAIALARRLQDGEEHIPGLEGLILVAGSPPCPEPMDEAQRTKMMGWFAGDADRSRSEARQYIAANNEKLSQEQTDASVSDVLRTNRAAWLAWLNAGSREDWSQRAGVLDVPALVIAGADDEQLGPQAQRELTMPHFSHARLMTLTGAKHLLPMECPDELANAFQEHVRYARYLGLIGSVRVGTKTRNALLARERPDDPAYEPAALDAAAFRTLRAVVDRVVPQPGAPRIDLAARIDTELREGAGDGWRFALLPADAVAYAAALRTLDDVARAAHGSPFAELDASDADDLLTRAHHEHLDLSNGAGLPSRLGSAQMRAWFEDLRADAVRAYMAHPQTLARLGYSGIANGGDGDLKSGFARVGIDRTETWEPIAGRPSVK